MDSATFRFSGCIVTVRSSSISISFPGDRGPEVHLTGLKAADRLVFTEVIPSTSRHTVAELLASAQQLCQSGGAR